MEINEFKRKLSDYHLSQTFMTLSDYIYASEKGKVRVRKRKEASRIKSAAQRPETFAAEGEILGGLEERAKECVKCPLSESRTKLVFGKGAADAKLVFVGEAPGEQEDQQGLPFVGRAGKLLDKWIAAAGLSLDDVYVMNTLKCRPPNNRDPLPEEKAACRSWFDAQLEALKPKCIIALGKQGFSNLVSIDMSAAFGKHRGRLHDYNGVPVVATYHPSYILRNGGGGPEAAKVYDDFLLAFKAMGEEPPESLSAIKEG